MAAKKKQARRGRGRPKIYSKKLAARVCFLVSTNARGIRAICKDNPEIPGVDSIYKWMVEEDGFAEQYAEAKANQVEQMAEDILAIADDGSEDWETRTRADGSEYEAVNGEVIQRSRLRVDTRKWLMSKLMPKKYADLQRREVDQKSSTVIAVLDHAGLDLLLNTPRTREAASKLLEAHAGLEGQDDGDDD